MKIKVYGGGPSFCARIDGTDSVLVLSKGLTAYETAHELAAWLEIVTEPPTPEAPSEEISLPTELEPVLAVLPAPVAPAPTEPDPHPVAAPEGELAS